MRLELREHVELGPRTSLQVGGQARYWVEARDIDTVVRAHAWARERQLPVIPLGGGSNVVVADRDLEALVLKVCADSLQSKREGGTWMVHAGAGLEWDELVRWAVQHDAAGIECLAGIPGRVGAAPIQNIGAYGQQVADCLTAVHAVERATGLERSFSREECGFGYRQSVFKNDLKDRYVVVGVDFHLVAGGAPTLAYPELERAVAETNRQPTVASVCQTVLELRRGKSMLIDPQDDNHRSVGSFFVNPTLEPSAVARLHERVRAALGPSEQLPQFDADDGKVKVPAAWLIERAGFSKGTRRGPVGLSSQHALAIVNRGGATAREIIAFAAEIRATVQERFGVRLTPEPQLLGFTAAELRPLVD